MKNFEHLTLRLNLPLVVCSKIKSISSNTTQNRPPLSQTNDGVPQRGDIVDIGEHPVLAGVGSEYDGADALDLHGGGVLKLDQALNIGVKFEEELPLHSHVVSGIGVKAPPIDLVATGPVSKEDMAHGSSRWSAGVV